MDKFNNSSNINLTPIPKTSPNISKSKINKSSFNISNRKTANNSHQTASTKHFFNPGEDLTYLISNSKQIENMLLLNDENYSSYVTSNNIIDQKTKSYYEEKIFVLEKEISNLNDQKIKLEKSFNEIKTMLSQFDVKYASFSSTFFEDDEKDEQPPQRKKINYEISNKIIHLYTNKLFNEASELWKLYNFSPLLGVSLERSYEIMVYLTKMKDRQIKKIMSVNSSINRDNSEEEAKKKNCEIVELLTKNEFYQYKLDEREIQLNDLRNRLKGLIDDNNELFTQNRKLKYLIESNNNF